MTGGGATRRSLVAALALAGAGAAAALAAPANAPAASSRATIRVSHACYQTAEQGTLHGKGFDPDARWSATLDGKPFGHGTTSSRGGITASFGVPSHLRSGSTGEDSYTLVVRERKRSASISFLVTHVNASFSPTGGNLLTLKVHFRLLGWGRGGSLYLHYLSPKGTLRLNRYLGPAQGVCGHLSTSLLKLFQFTPTHGVWTLQFDKRAVYSSKSLPRAVVRYRVG